MKTPALVFLTAGLLLAQQQMLLNFGAGGVVTLVHANSSRMSCGTTCGFTITSTTAGNALVACVLGINTSGTPTVTVADNQTNSWTMVAATRQTAVGTAYTQLMTECAWARSIAAATTTVTFTFTAAVTVAIAIVEEVTPINASPVDQTLVGTGTAAGGTSPPTTTAGSTGVAGEFIVAATGMDDEVGLGGIWSAGANFTLEDNSGGGGEEDGTERWAKAAAGSVTPGFTCASCGGLWVISALSVKP